MKQIAYLILALNLITARFSWAEQSNTKQENFSPVKNEVSSAERKLITSFGSPSELACSQKCVNNEKCKYKKYGSKSKTCELLEAYNEEDFEPDVILTKKETCLNKETLRYKLMPEYVCGGNCSKINGVCDCREQGVYASCGKALTANSFRQAVYWIFHASIQTLLAIECTMERKKAFAVLHHDNEEITFVNGYEEPGSYRRKFQYDMKMQLIIRIIRHSIHCKQHTLLRCHDVGLDGANWINGRDGRKLEYWGGGPSNGTGCACGITNTCASVGKKCNCDSNDNVWRIDKGFVTKKGDLPVTAINVGDTGRSVEKLKYTVGPLKCVL